MGEDKMMFAEYQAERHKRSEMRPPRAVAASRPSASRGRRAARAAYAGRGRLGSGAWAGERFPPEGDAPPRRCRCCAPHRSPRPCGGGGRPERRGLRGVPRPLRAAGTRRGAGHGGASQSPG